MKKNNAWNIRRLVDESFVPLTQRPSILYWRLSDFRKCLESKYASIHMVGRSKLFRSTSWQAVLPQIFTRITLLSSLVAIANCLCCLQVFGCFSIVQNTLSEIKYHSNSLMLIFYSILGKIERCLRPNKKGHKPLWLKWL